MSGGSIFGFITGWLLIVVTILLSTSNPGVFVDIPSIIVVLGGSYMAMFIAYEAKDVFYSFRLLGDMFKKPPAALSYKDEVGRIIRWAYIVQKNGMQGLENDAQNAVGLDPFTRYSIDLVITGYSPADIREILKESAYGDYQRKMQKIDVLKNLGGNTPAFGMLGTLIGLIVMLGNMSDPSSIGAGMAVALITTLYGIIAARLLYLPAMTKLTQRADDILFRNMLMIEACVSIAERKSPRFIQDKINAFLDPSQHFLIDRDMH